MADSPGELVLLLLHDVGVRELLGEVLTLWRALLPHCRQEGGEFVDIGLVLGYKGSDGGVGDRSRRDDGRFPQTGCKGSR